MFPLLHNLHQGIEILVVGRVFQNCPWNSLEWYNIGLPPCIKTAPITFLLESISTSKGCCKFINDIIYASRINFLTPQMPFVDPFPIRNSCHSLLWHGVALLLLKTSLCISLGIVLPPMKLLTSKKLVGIFHYMMASILEVSILNSPPRVTYPRHTENCCAHSHFLIFSSSWCFSNVSRTCIKCEMCFSEAALYTIISSK